MFNFLKAPNTAYTLYYGYMSNISDALKKKSTTKNIVFLHLMEVLNFLGQHSSDNGLRPWK